MRTPAPDHRRRLCLATAIGAAAIVLLTLLPAATAQAATSCDPGTGPHQTKVERFLGLAPDGKNSRSDCRAIRAFQRINGIESARGYAGHTTSSLITRLRKSDDRADR